MNNKIATNIYLSTIESKIYNEQIRTETESWIESVCFDGCQMEEGVGEWMKR